MNSPLNLPRNLPECVLLPLPPCLPGPLKRVASTAAAWKGASRVENRESAYVQIPCFRSAWHLPAARQSKQSKPEVH